MKKSTIYNSMMMLVIMASMSMGFTSCSDDDDDLGDGAKASSLHGTWVGVGAVHTFIFDKDGTYTHSQRTSGTPISTKGSYRVLSSTKAGVEILEEYGLEDYDGSVTLFSVNFSPSIRGGDIIAMFYFEKEQQLVIRGFETVFSKE